jgi:hypothetical protein
MRGAGLLKLTRTTLQILAGWPTPVDCMNRIESARVWTPGLQPVEDSYAFSMQGDILVVVSHSPKSRLQILECSKRRCLKFRMKLRGTAGHVGEVGLAKEKKDIGNLFYSRDIGRNLNSR